MDKIDQSFKELFFSTDARQKVRAGVNKVADAVSATLGPRGRNALIHIKDGDPLVTKDGISVAKHVKLSDPLENLGAKLIIQTARKVNDLAGDGTTTVTVLTRAMVNEGLKYLEAGVDAQALRRGMECAKDRLLERLKEQAVPVTSIKEVATISANDPEIGETIADIMAKIGEEGAITLDKSQTTETEIEVVQGLHYRNGFQSPYLVTDRGQMTAEYKDVPVLLTDEKMNLKQVVRIMQMMADEGKKDLVIICEQMDDEVLRVLAVNKIQGNFNCLAVRPPKYGTVRREYLHDLAALTGATFVGSDGAVGLDDVALDHLGFAQKVVADEKYTTVVGNDSQKEIVTRRVKEIRQQIEKTKSKHDLGILKERLSKLKGGIGIIRVGANTEAALTEKLHRTEDAVNATRAAIEEGIVPGGGQALFKISQDFGDVPDDDDEAFGVNIVLQSLKAPMRKIISNAGKDPGEVMGRILQEGTGFNAKTLEFSTDMVKDGIIDPVKVTRLALEGAVETASLILTTEVGIVPENNEEENKDK